MLNGNTDSGFKNGTLSKAIQIHCDCVVGSLQDAKACVSNAPGMNGTKETIFGEDSNPLVVDLEFSALIPPLQQDERLLLEESLLREGCRDALVVWIQKPTEEQSACECEIADKWKFLKYDLPSGFVLPCTHDDSEDLELTTAWEC